MHANEWDSLISVYHHLPQIYPLSRCGCGHKKLFPISRSLRNFPGKSPYFLDTQTPQSSPSSPPPTTASDSIRGMSTSSQHQFRYTQTPSKVLHLRNLPWECTDDELVELCRPFGKIVNTKCNVGANRNQAFVEFVSFLCPLVQLWIFSFRVRVLIAICESLSSIRVWILHGDKLLFFIRV